MRSLTGVSGTGDCPDISGAITQSPKVYPVFYGSQWGGSGGLIQARRAVVDDRDRDVPSNAARIRGHLVRLIGGGAEAAGQRTCRPARSPVTSLWSNAARACVVSG